MANVTIAELEQAASVLVDTGVRLHDRERFVVVCDTASARIAEALRSRAASASLVTVCDLDRLESATSVDRPHRTLPDPLRQAIDAASASIFVASAPHGEATMVSELVHLATAARRRHAHLPGVTELGFARGLRTDCDKVAAAGGGLLRQIDFARTLDAESAVGTRLSMTFASQTRWTPFVGALAEGGCTWYPAGTLYATPESVSGVFVANASLGEFFGERERLLLQHPVRFTIEAGRVVQVEAQHAPSLRDDILGMLGVAANSDRIGAVAIGVNIGIETPIGEASVDIAMPGLHLVIGDPAGKSANATFTARTSFAACSAGAIVKVDGKLARVS